jgi:hypothetical protein
VIGLLRKLSQKLGKINHSNLHQSGMIRAAKLLAAVDGISKVEALQEGAVVSLPTMASRTSTGDSRAFGDSRATLEVNRCRLGVPKIAKRASNRNIVPYDHRDLLARPGFAFHGMKSHITFVAN